MRIVDMGTGFGGEVNWLGGEVNWNSDTSNDSKQKEIVQVITK